MVILILVMDKRTARVSDFSIMVPFIYEKLGHMLSLSCFFSASLVVYNHISSKITIFLGP